jgi:hypothetical protein
MYVQSKHHFCKHKIRKMPYNNKISYKLRTILILYLRKITIFLLILIRTKHKHLLTFRQ